jgi:hypothetical protein
MKLRATGSGVAEKVIIEPENELEMVSIQPENALERFSLSQKVIVL